MAATSAMAEFGRVQPVDGPELPIVDAWVGREVDAEPAVQVVDLVVDDVQDLDAASHRMGQEAGQPEYAGVVVEADGQQEALCSASVAAQRRRSTRRASGSHIERMVSFRLITIDARCGQ
jgi:hypothetical protein